MTDTPGVGPESQPTSSPQPPSAIRFALLLLGAFVIAGLLAIGAVVPVDRAGALLRTWAAERGAAGMIGFGAAYVALALLFVPGAALTLVAGAIYGFVWGTIVVSLASVTADAVAFLVARYLARRRVEQLARRHPRFGAVDRAVADGGWRMVALLRLSPAIPYSASNYLYGLTGISFWPYLLASWIFTLPGTCVYVYLGFVGAEAAGGRSRSAAEWVLLAVGLGATVAATAYITRLARRAMRNVPDRAPDLTRPCA